MRIGSWMMGAALLCMPLSATAQGANYTRQGFVFPTDRKPHVLVLYPDWFIGSLTTKGEGAINPDWASAAFDNMRRAMIDGPIGSAADLRFMTAEQSQSSPVLADARESFKWRVGELIFRVPQGTMPVTKGKKGNYDYTIGPDLAARIKQAHGDADYALFIVMHDAYATAGQKIGSILGASVLGLVSPPGSPGTMRAMPPHFGNAMLVDLKDGSIVWFHGDGAYGGDPRTLDGAVKRMGQAMERFPGTVVARR